LAGCTPYTLGWIIASRTTFFRFPASIYSAEQAIKARFFAPEVVKEGLAAQWRRLLTVR